MTWTPQLGQLILGLLIAAQILWVTHLKRVERREAKEERLRYAREIEDRIDGLSEKVDQLSQKEKSDV